MDALTPRERRLRRALVALAMVLAVALLAVAAVVVYWRMYLLGPEGSPFTRGPYLLGVDRDAATLRWRTDGDREVRVTALDDAGGQLAATAADGGAVLRGLRPGTRYAWTASVDGVGRASGSFRTPSDDPDAPIRIAALADYGIGGDEQYAVARTIAAEQPDLVLTAGDNSYLSAPDILLDRNVFRPMAELMRNAPVYVGLGDHEALPPGDGAIRSAFDIPPGGLRVVRYGPVQAVMLGDRADAAGIAFARRALAQPGFRHRFLVQHRPPKAGDALVHLARKAGVDAIISGHLHRYERRVVDGVRCFTVGTGGGRIGADEFTRPTAGAQVSLTRFGHLRIDIRGPEVSYTFVDLTGRVADRAGPP